MAKKELGNNTSQTENNLTQKSTLLGKVGLYLKRALLKVKGFFSVIFKKMGVFFKRFGKVMANFYNNIIKKGAIAVFKFFKKVFRKIARFFRNLSPRAKAIIITTLVFCAFVGSAFGYIFSVQANNLSTYNLFAGIQIQQQSSDFPDAFLDIDWIYYEEVDFSEHYYLLYKAYNNSYNYYVPYLMSITSGSFLLNTDAEERNDLNNTVRNYESKLSYMLEQYDVLVDSLATYVEGEEESVYVPYREIGRNLFDLTAISVELIPQLQMYVEKYSNIADNENELRTALVKAQASYANAIIKRASQNLNVLGNYAQLNSIIEKYEAFGGTSSSAYADAFVEASQNYEPRLLFEQDDQLVYIDTLTGVQKTYAQAFYDFLNESSYN
ncbi:MAG: hypothetical protein AB7S44_02240 [Spirochaetales bacterium]